MASLIEGYNYDIFISYRQKDNKYDGWVTEFVENLKKELEATFKEDINVYFDINPHDGLLETHDVGDSLKDKLKCLIFIPVISKTYCDPKSFAWEHEFKAFVKIASEDKYGLKVKLTSGNVAYRVLPVRIYELDKEDIRQCEEVIGGVLRGIEFIYKSAGVNRPLRAIEDHAQDNLNKTYYRDQINKLAHSIQEIILGLRTEKNHKIEEKERQPATVSEYHDHKPMKIRQPIIKNKKYRALIYFILFLMLSSILILLYPTKFNTPILKGYDSEEVLQKAISVVDPYSYWGNYKGKIHCKNIRINAEISSDEIIEIDTKNDYYKNTMFVGTQEKIVGVENGKSFSYTIDENKKIVENIIQEDNTGLGNISWRKGWQYSHFGLLMELKKSGLILDRRVSRKEFKGTNCITLNFTSKNANIKESCFKGTNWKLYINPIDYSLLGYEFEGVTNVNAYVVVAGSIQINNIILPMCKIYYSSSDNKFIAVDIFTPVN